MASFIFYASPSPSLSPSSSPPPPPYSNGFTHFFKLLAYSRSPQGQLLRIDLTVLLTSTFLLLLFLYGGMKQSVNLGWFSSAMKGVYVLIPVCITYIIGLMHDASFIHELFPVWAFLLLYVYGGVDTVTACSFSDSELPLRYALHYIPISFWGGWLAGLVITEAQVSIPLLLLFFLVTWNTGETLEALYRASKAKGLPLVMEPKVCYMRKGRDVPNEDEADPVSMRGYRFLVSDKDANNIITIEDIWQSEGRLLKGGSDGTTSCAHTEHYLKDLSISFALFWLLLTRFAGYESSNQKTRKFVEAGLLSIERGRVERVFHLIEVELNFVFDFFYTKLYVLSTLKTRHKIRKVGCAVLFLWFAIVTLYRHSPKEKYVSVEYHGHSMEVGVTRGVVASVAILEIWQISMYFLSNWKVVMLLCDYVKEPHSKRGKSKENQIKCIWTIRNFLLRGKLTHFFSKPLAHFFFKPWQRELGQYSFIESYDRVPKWQRLYKIANCCLSGLLKIPRLGQTGNSSFPLSIEVKQAIVSSLVNNGLSLSRGIATLQRNELLHKISCSSQLTTNAHFILVWHIATGACESFSTPQYKDEHFYVANQLSKYCAYLLTFAPELLPDHPYTTECVFDKAVIEALKIFEGLNVLEQRYQKMATIVEEDGGNNIVAKGAVLANELTDLVIRDPSKGWRVLAEFWAEVLLYMAPSDNAAAHGEHLAQGGEFITHLWALLTHAGIVTRDSCKTTV